MLSELGHPVTTAFPSSNLIGSPACGTAGTFLLWCYMMPPQFHKAHMSSPSAEPHVGTTAHAQLKASSLMPMLRGNDPLCVRGCGREGRRACSCL